MMKKTNPIKGILFDLDGVFYIGNTLLPGALKTLEWINSLRIKHCFVTNSSTQEHLSLLHKLQHMGLTITPEQLISAPSVALHMMQKAGIKQCHLVIAQQLKPFFRPFTHTEGKVDAILIGDIGETWNYTLLNRLFNELNNGAKLYALHQNRYWQTAKGLKLDIGAFIAALEYASGQKATLFGKPAPAMFQTALERLNLAPDNVIMVGDDLYADIQGAQQHGIGTVLVKTGKFRPELLSNSKITPDDIIDSIADLSALLS